MVPVRALIDAETIRSRVQSLAGTIAVECAPSPPVVVGILNGAVRFMMDLLAAFPSPLAERIDYDFLDAKSYRGTGSTGRVELSRDLVVPVTGRPVLAVDGIVDTGQTVSQIVAYLRDQGASSVRVCALLDKPSHRQVEVALDYVGFEIDDAFVVGYGMDCDQQYRSLPYIGILSD